MRVAAAWILGALTAPAAADGLEFRFEYSPAFPAPSSSVRVSIHAVIPPHGTVIPWTTPPGMGQPGILEGYAGSWFNLSASAGSWSGLIIGPKMFPNCSFSACPTGQVAGSNVNNITPWTGFGPPVAGPDILLWSGLLTLPAEPIPSGVLTLETAFVPVGTPPVTGIEVQLSGIMPLNVSHYLTATNAYAVLQVPAPAGAVLFAFGVLGGSQRRRQ